MNQANLSDGIQDPPVGLWNALKQIGPGIILAGTIVGSGELILTTAIGAKHGFTFLWLILFSCVIKVFVQIELGRYAISSGLPTLGALQQVSRVRALGNALLIWWFVMMVFTVFQLGGMTGGVAQSLNLAFPSFGSACVDGLSWLWPSMGESASRHPEMPWALATCIVTVLLIYNGSYRRIERFTTMLVVGVTMITLIAAISLIWTPYCPELAKVLEGLRCNIPAAGIADAFAVFGITGVGATELFYYPYWCLEKGYAKFVGPRDDSPEWEHRAKGWIRVMHLDAWTSMVVFTISTVAFYTMGAAVLHPQGLIPEKSEMVSTLSKMYKGPFGDWTQILFLIGAGAVLFKTLYLASAANSRMLTNFFALFSIAGTRTEQGRNRWIRTLCVLFPIVALLLYIRQHDPRWMVQLGGVAQAATLPMMAFATICFRYFWLDQRLRPNKLSDVLLWIATLSIFIVAFYSVSKSISDLFPNPPTVRGQVTIERTGKVFWSKAIAFGEAEMSTAWSTRNPLRLENRSDTPISVTVLR